MIRVAGSMTEELDTLMNSVRDRAMKLQSNAQEHSFINATVINAKAIWRPARNGKPRVFRCWELNGRRIGYNALMVALPKAGLAE